MRTKEEITNHVKNVGYSKTARKEICAFLIGLGIKSKNESIQFVVKDDKSFDDFYKWYENKDGEKHNFYYRYDPFREIFSTGFCDSYGCDWSDNKLDESMTMKYDDLCKRGVEEFNVGDKVMFGLKDGEKQIHKGKIISLFLDIAPIDSNFYITIRRENGNKIIGSEDDFDFVVRDEEK